MERRTRSGGGARLSLSDCGMLACDILAGRLITDPTAPKLTAISNRVVAETNRSENDASPVVKLMTAPSPLAWPR